VTGGADGSATQLGGAGGAVLGEDLREHQRTRTRLHQPPATGDDDHMDGVTAARQAAARVHVGQRFVTATLSLAVLLRANA
jgi:hypothetical protein